MSVNGVVKKASPFELDNEAEYQDWREQKLLNYPDAAEQLIVEINNPLELSKGEKSQIIELYNKTNMVVYVSKAAANPDKELAKQLASQFGLTTLDNNMGADDGITSLQVSNSKGRERYIPYSNKAIHWHTDGYYNELDRQIHALNLHCVRPARQGGENALMDHEIAYIQLRDLNPDYIEALMVADAMTIPANIKDDVVIRPDRAGPVFSVTRDDTLHMRYTARAHNVIWKENQVTKDAVHAIESILHSASQYIYRLTLQPGWGLISNNVLHDRSEFEDDENSPRLLYRLRYYERLMAS